MSESNPFHPEAENFRTPEKMIFSSLGIAWDARLEAGDRKKLDVENIVKNISKLCPQYFDYIQKLSENDVAKVLKETKQSQKDEEKEKLKNNFCDLVDLFVERIEFFRRLNPPEKVPTGGRTVEQLEEALAQANMNISDPAREMMHKTITTDEYGVFTTTKEAKTIDFVRFNVKDLFRDKKNHAFKEIIDKAQELGLEIC